MECVVVVGVVVGVVVVGGVADAGVADREATQGVYEACVAAITNPTSG